MHSKRPFDGPLSFALLAFACPGLDRDWSEFIGGGSSPTFKIGSAAQFVAIRPITFWC